VVAWAVEAALIGYLGGAVFTGRPILGLLLAGAVALAISGLALLIQHVFAPAPAESIETERTERVTAV